MKVFRSISFPPSVKIALNLLHHETPQFEKSTAWILDGVLQMRQFLTKKFWTESLWSRAVVRLRRHHPLPKRKQIADLGDQFFPKLIVIAKLPQRCVVYSG